MSAKGAITQELMQEGPRAAPVALYVGSVAAGIDWGSVAAFAAAVYSLCLIIEKLWRLWKWMQPRFKAPPA